jgi:4-amino-4-deoxy-L-arabinose transferase-like glycosyltransferase
VNSLRRLGGSPVAWAATALFVATMVLWTVVTPSFRSPDEPQHVNSVVRLTEGGGWPAPGEAYMSPEVLRAKTLSGFSAVDGQLGNWWGGTLLPGVRPEIPAAELLYFALYSDQQPRPQGERLPFSALEPTRPVDVSLHPDQMSQHPPLYYAVTAAVVELVGADEWRFDRELALMRLVSVALVAPLPLLAWSAAVRLSGRRRVADVAAVLPLAIPQLAAQGGSVTNDALVVALGAVLTVLLVRALTGDGSWRTTVGVGLVLGLGLLTKGTLLVAVPVVGVALVLAGRRVLALSWSSTLLRLGVAWGLAFVIGGWWWVLNVLRYGTLQPSGWNQDYAAGLVVDRPRDSLLGFVPPFSEKLTTTFWGNFGQLELALPLPLAVVLSVVLFACVLAAFRRRCAGTRIGFAVLLAMPLLTLVLVAVQTYAGHLDNGQYGGIQGRYLYGGLVAVLAAAAVGIGSLVRPGGRAERWLPAFVLVPALATGAYGLWFAFRGYYVDAGWTDAEAWRRMADWSPWPAWAVDGLALGVIVVAILACAVALGSAFRAPADAPGPGGADGLPGRSGTPSARPVTTGGPADEPDRLDDTRPVGPVRRPLDA